MALDSVREILHWLVDEIHVPHYAKAGGPSPEQAHAKIDEAYGYVPPVETKADKAAKALAEAQAALDAALAEEKAGVEHADETS